MLREIGRWRALASASFALAVLALGGFGLYQVAGRQWRVQPTFHVRARFETISGVEAGHRVRIQGIDAGVVEKVIPPQSREVPSSWSCGSMNGCEASFEPMPLRIVSEGLVGQAHRVDAGKGRRTPQVAELDMLASEQPIEMTDLMQKAAASLARLDAATVAAEKGLAEVNAIAASIHQGEGSLGKLIRDDSLHQNSTELSHRSEQTLTSLDENLAALKETWPLSRYFERRAYSGSRSDCLPAGLRTEQPGARDRRPVRIRPLGPDARRPDPPRRDRPLVQVRWPPDLTNCDRRLHRRLEQPRPCRDPHAGAGRLRSQIPGRQARDPVGGLVQSRKVAAVGFGANFPRTLDPRRQGAPSRRVEIILFTPQT